MSFVRTYDPETAPRGFLRHAWALRTYPALIGRNRYMIYNSFRRELMSRFHGSFLGAWWMLMQPLFLFCVYYLVFGYLFAGRGSGSGGPNPEFAIYLFSGIIVFHALMEAVGKCVGIVTANSNLVKKVAFPSETLVLPPAMMSIVLWAVGGLVCLMLGASFGVLQPGWMLLTLPLVLILQFLFVVGFGLLLANANVFVRDVSNLWRIASMAWFFLTPIFWNPTMLGGLYEHGLGWLEPLIRYANPTFSLLMCHRIAIGGVSPELGEFWPQLGVFATWTAVLLVIGYSSFTANKHKYADII